MKIILSLTIALVIFFNSSAQTALDVADITLKIGAKSEETLYYGFAEGDQILFSFKEIDGNAIKEVEIIALPESSKFKDYEVKEVNNKTISVYKKGIYRFRFHNSALLKGRICSIKIKRIPKNPAFTQFNTAVKWVEKMDTTYELKTETVYNAAENQLVRKKLVRIDTTIVSVIDRTERVSSMSKLGDANVQYISVKLPQNTYYPDAANPYQKTEVISWAYSLAVGGTGAAWYKSANEKAGGKIAATVAKAAAGAAIKRVSFQRVTGLWRFWRLKACRLSRIRRKAITLNLAFGRPSIINLFSWIVAIVWLLRGA